MAFPNIPEVKVLTGSPRELVIDILQAMSLPDCFLLCAAALHMTLDGMVHQGTGDATAGLAEWAKDYRANPLGDAQGMIPSIATAVTTTMATLLEAVVAERERREAMSPKDRKKMEDAEKEAFLTSPSPEEFARTDAWVKSGSWAHGDEPAPAPDPSPDSVDEWLKANSR